jgi:hypothetical protein
MYNLFSKTAKIITGILFILAGTIAILIPWLPSIRTEIVYFILEKSMILFVMGVALLIIGLAMIAYVRLSTGQRTFYVRHAPHPVEVKLDTVSGYLNTYFKEMFPGMEIPHEVILHRNKIRLYVDFPYIIKEEQEPLTDRLYEELAGVLDEKLGCTYPLELSVSYNNR